MASSSSTLTPGTMLGQYRVVGLLAAGGSSDVYVGEDPGLGRKVALKVLRCSGQDADDKARFEREGRALARIDHDHVVRVFASGTVNEQPWLAMEFVDGDPLGALVPERGMDEETALLLGAQLARGLAAIHAQGIVHRDIKPDNALVDEAGRVRITDFGIAAVPGTGGFVTRAGTTVGTPHFMAPEQARGAPCGPATDVWGLGATLTFLLTGAPPFWDPSAEPDMPVDAEVLARVLRDPVPGIRTRRPDVSATTADLVQSLLSRDAEARPHVLAPIAEAMEAHADRLADLVVESMPEPMTPERASPAQLGPARGSPGLGSPELDSPAQAGNAAAGNAIGERSKPVLVLGAIAATALLSAGSMWAYLQTRPAVPGTHDAGAQAATRDAGASGQATARVRVVPVDAGLVAGLVPASSAAEAVDAGFVDDGPDVLAALVGTDEAASVVAATHVLDAPAPDGPARLLELLVRNAGARAVLLSEVQSRRRTDVVPTLGAALLKADGAAADALIQTLETLRTAAALNALMDAAQKHPERAVKHAAARAQRRLFHVESAGPDTAESDPANLDPSPPGRRARFGAPSEELP